MDPKTKEISQKPEATAKKASFAAKAVLVGALLTAGCTPNVSINNKYYDPNQDDAATACQAYTDCTPKTAYLRESGNSAGTDKMDLGNGTLTFKGLVSQGSTQAADLVIDACGSTAEGKFVAKGSSVLQVGSDAFEVAVPSIEYDDQGLVVKVLSTPVSGQCAEDSGSADGGTE